MKNNENGLSHFVRDLKSDEDWLLAWHYNIAMWLFDHGNTNHKISNELAYKFINYFFDINYNWQELIHFDETKD
jgi:hypothetical protein